MTSRLVLRPSAPGEPVLFTVDPRGRERATDADEIGLSDELAETIEEWLDDLDAIYDDDAGKHAPADATTRDEHRAIAASLVEAIREELGEDWQVESALPDNLKG